jgi:hypothetical protein
VTRYAFIAYEFEPWTYRGPFGLERRHPPLRAVAGVVETHLPSVARMVAVDHLDPVDGAPVEVSLQAIAGT